MKEPGYRKPKPAPKSKAAPSVTASGRGAPSAAAGKPIGAPTRKRGSVGQFTKAKPGKPLSIAAQKAIAGKLDRQQKSSDYGRREADDRQQGLATARRSSNVGRPLSESRGPRETGLGGEQVEGRQAVRELLLAGTRRTREIWIAEDIDPAPILDDIIELAEESRVIVKHVGRRQIENAARTDAPQGVIAFAQSIQPVELDELAVRQPGRPAPFLLALDGVTDPGNLGAVLRSAECSGVTGVILPKHRAVHITPTVAKTAAGAIEHLPMAMVGGLPNALKRLSELGVWSIGLDAAADISLHQLSGTDAPVVLVLGAEGAGLSRLVRERCDSVVSIPMAGRLDSLNVSVAGALACFEVARGRVRKTLE